jgi:hypothetical protein
VEVLGKVLSEEQVEQDDSQDVDLDAPVTKVVSLTEAFFEELV